MRIKCAELALGLHHRIFQVEWGWFSGHYEKDGDGEYSRNDYPIPVISVKGYCDIEVNPDCVTVTAKRKRRDVLEGDFEKSFAKLTAYPFEAFGVEGYLDGFYQPGMTLEQFRVRRPGTRARLTQARRKASSSEPLIALISQATGWPSSPTNLLETTYFTFSTAVAFSAKNALKLIKNPS